MESHRERVAPIVEAKAQLVWRASSSMLRTSYGAPPDRRPHVMVRLVDERGRVGYGEAAPLPQFTGETADGILLHLRRRYLPLLIGRTAFELSAVRMALDAALPGNSSARAAIDVAMHDLMGRGAGLGVADLLGGPVRDSVPCTMPLGVDDVPATVAAAERAVARGIGTLKMKIGPEPDADIERVRAVRAAVGDGVAIRIDANQGYDVPTAMRVVGRLADIGIEYVEQPVAQWDHAGLAEVRRHTGVPIGVDEGLHTLRDAVRLIELGAADHFMIKLIKTGGLGPARAIAELAAAHRIGIVVVSPFETQVGAAAGLALALAAPTATLAHELRVFDSQADMADTGIGFRDGRVHPGADPGLGITSIVELEGLNWDAKPAPQTERAGAI
jgi:muconate cycloisomerase